MNNYARNLRLPGLDGLRGISILLVILCHSHWSGYFHFSNETALKLDYVTYPLGLFGVPIFFVISGFLITYILLREEKLSGSISLRQFWMKRFLRIVPPVLIYIVFIIIYAKFSGVHLDGLDLTAVFFFFRNLVDGKAMLAHFWSLSIEEQFYLFWPLILVFISRRWRFQITLVLILTFPLIRILSVLLFHTHADFILCLLRFDSILSGCLLAVGWDRLGYCKLSTKNGNELFVGGFLSIFIAWFISYYSGVNSNIPEANMFYEPLLEVITIFLNVGICGIMIALVTESTQWGRFFNSKWLASIGLISYSLYIWQQFFFYAPSLPNWMCYLSVRVGCAFVVAVLAYYFLERPLNKFRHRIGLKRTKRGEEQNIAAGVVTSGEFH